MCEAGKGKGAVVIRSASGTAMVLAVWLGFVGAALAAEQQRKLTAGQVFRDCDGCPEMVVVPAGSFLMGSPSSEKGRLVEGRFDVEGPLREVAIPEPFAVGVYEVTRGEFARFVSVSGHSPGNSCGDYYFLGPFGGRLVSGMNWNKPGYGQTGGHPVVCVSWEDAKAYARWLSRETGEEYRLLSEAEWEYAARGGSATARYWGEGEGGQCRHVNGMDREAKDWADREIGGNWEDSYRWLFGRMASCNDGHVHTAPVGSYEANGFGLHDVLGNVGEWVEDCVNDDSDGIREGSGYRGAPSDGSAWVSGDCSRRVWRGGSWIFPPTLLRSATRAAFSARVRVFFLGFRVARTLAPGTEPAQQEGRLRRFEDGARERNLWSGAGAGKERGQS